MNAGEMLVQIHDAVETHQATHSLPTDSDIPALGEDEAYGACSEQPESRIGNGCGDIGDPSYY